MKRFLYTFTVCMLVLTSAACISAQASEKNSITVSGRGTIKAKPDIAIVNLGVETRNVDSVKAQEETSKKMETVIQKLKEMGIAEKYMRTSNISIYPSIDYQNNQTTGYVASHSIEVKIKDLQSVGQIIDAAITLGANSSGGIQFSIEDPAIYYNEALVIAVKNAKSKADVLAQALGVTVGQPAALTEQSDIYVAPLYAGGLSKGMDRVEAAAGAPVEQGMLDITAAVTAVYQY